MPEGPSLRVDRFISESWGLLSRSQIKARSAIILVNGKEVKPSRIVNCGDVVELAWSEAEQGTLLPERLPFSILFENDRVLVIDKSQGMVSHPANGNWTGTLVNAVLGYLGGLEGVFSADGPDSAPRSLRPGMVHRLDKDTSGLIIMAKDPEAQDFLSAQFRERTVKKQYLAIVRGVPKPPEGLIDTLLSRDPLERKRFTVSQGKGKRAITRYRVIRSAQGYSLVSLRLYTGRTHQLRVHMRHAGCPILGDPIYARRDHRFPEATLMLHAFRLKIRLPGEAEARIFCAPLPDRMKQLIAQLGFNRQ